MNRKQRRADKQPVRREQGPEALNDLGLALARQGRLGEAAACYRRAIALRSNFPQAHNNLGLVLIDLGQTDEAVGCCRRAIALKPDYPQAHNNLGTALRQKGRLEEAAGCYHTAVALKADFAPALNNLGLTLAQLDRREEAVACYRRALACQPDLPQAHNNLGNALKDCGQVDEAIRCYRRAIELNPDQPEQHNNLGLALRQLGRLDDAMACYHRALSLRPDYPQAHNNLGAALAERGELDAAVGCYRRSLELRPDFAEAHNNLGVALAEQGRLDAAAACYRRAIALVADYPEPHNNLGTALREQGRLDEAVACYRRAIALRPDYAGAHNNLGAALAQRGQSAEVVGCYQRALDLEPDDPRPHNNLGTALGEQGQLADAVVCFRRAIALQPDYPEPHNNLAMALLAGGDFPLGWQEYEWRWQTAQMRRARRDFAQPQWRGEAGGGRTLLIHAEQGFGDTLQFCRYGALAAAHGLMVTMAVPRPLVRLLDCLPGIERVVAEDDDLPAFDLHCPMLSLPLALGTTVATIPGRLPYLVADPAAAAFWRKRLANAGAGGLHVGLVWAGNPRRDAPIQAAVDRRRSVAPELLAPVMAVPGVRFVSLQKDGPPAAFTVTDFMQEIGDFADTAALIANLDLVISVDTAVAHLAAALGKPVWVLDRFDHCWRWLAGRRDSPWYPTLRLYRQARPGDWSPVIEEVAADLRRLAAITPERYRSAGPSRDVPLQ